MDEQDKVLEVILRRRGFLAETSFVGEYQITGSIFIRFSASIILFHTFSVRPSPITFAEKKTVIQN